MVISPTNRSALALRLMVGLALLSWSRAGGAQGTWSVISLPQPSSSVAVDLAGNLYVADQTGADYPGRFQIQKRDTLGNWSILATAGDGLGQVNYPTALTVDTVGDLYVADSDSKGYPRIQKRNSMGNWAVIATSGDALGQVSEVKGIAVNTVGILYVAEGLIASGFGENWAYQIQQRDAQGNWSVIAPRREGQQPVALAVDTVGNLYVACELVLCCNAPAVTYSSVEKWDGRENWSVIADTYTDPDHSIALAIAVDTTGNLYVVDVINDSHNYPISQIERRDAEGNWSVLAWPGTAVGPVDPAHDGLFGLSVDGAGNLYVYVVETGNNSVLKYTPAP
jgi:hypothetical protein